jgi:secondary thiamine-phosphate synthase enzyme
LPSNGDAHLKNLLIHHQVIAPVTVGRLDLGPWQQVYYVELDGERKKRAMIKVMGE